MDESLTVITICVVVVGSVGAGNVGAHPPTLRVRQRVGLWDLFTRLYNGQTDWPTGCLVNKRAAYKFQAPIFTPGDYLQRTPFGAPKEVFGKTHKSRRRGYWIPK